MTTAEGNKVRIGQQRLSPWIVEPVRRLQLRDMENVLQIEFARDEPDDEIMLTLNGGDQNHITPFRRPDDKMWARQEGWEPVLEKGTPTHNSAEKYARSGRLFFWRKGTETQLDSAHARPQTGKRLVDLAADPDAELAPDQIGFVTQVAPVKNADHYKIETTYSLPVG